MIMKSDIYCVEIRSFTYHTDKEDSCDNYRGFHIFNCEITKTEYGSVIIKDLNAGVKIEFYPNVIKEITYR